MKHKRVLGVVMALMMVIAFMPSLTFAEPASAEDDVICTVSIEGSSQTATKYSIADAIAAVNNNGTITVVGTINDPDSVKLGAYKNFTLDLTEATLAEGVEVKVTTEAHCLVKKGDVYSYHARHEFDSATAVPTKDPEYARVTIYCTHGDSFMMPEKVKYTEIKDETDETITYSATISDVFDIPTFTVEWTVEKAEVPTKYEIREDSVRYIRDKTGLAVLDEEGYPQFRANYTVDGKLARDDNYDPIELVGTVTDVEEGGAATTQDYGYSYYDVEFELPDGTIVEYKGDNAIWAANADKRDYPQPDNLIGIQFLVGDDEDDPDAWSDTVYPEWDAHQTATVDIPLMAVGDDGSFIYRYIWDTVTGEPEDEFVDFPAKHFPNNDSEEFDCGAAVYKYDAVSERYTDEDEEIITRTIKFSDFTVEGTHEYADRDNWAATFIQETPPTHSTTGEATAKCKYCGQEWADPDYFVIPRTDAHTFLQKDGEDVVITVGATCEHPGYQYKVCTVDDDMWDDEDEYLLTSGDVTITVELDDFIAAIEATGAVVPAEGHPVLVEDSIVPQKPHNYVTKATESETLFKDGVAWVFGATPAWTEDDGVVCLVNKGCLACQGRAVYAYTSWTVDEFKKMNKDFDSDYERVPLLGIEMYRQLDTPPGFEVYIIFEGVDIDVEDGKDCTEADEITFSVNDKDSKGANITKTVTSTVYGGPHELESTVTFSKDGKTATVTQQCATDGCLGLEDPDGNVAPQKVDADVTGKDNEDGSTTYTASLDGVELGTKTVFELDRAEVVVNDGEVIDLDKIPYDWDLKDVVKVYINGVEISSDLYDVQVVAPYWDDLSAGTNVILVTPAKDTNAVGSARGLAKCIELDELYVAGVTLDGNTIGGGGLGPHSITYDGQTHFVEVTKVKTEKDGGYITVKDADIEYAVVLAEEVRNPDFNPEDLDYSADPAELTDAGKYYVFAKMSKAAYETSYDVALALEITPYDIGRENTITANVQNMVYGEELYVTTGDADLDELIGLSGLAASWKGVGEYKISELVTWDPNYEVHFGGPREQVIKIEKRNATVVLKDTTKTWNGKEVALDDLYTVDGLAYFYDDLNVEVSTVGGKIAKEPGTYNLIATANNANYNIMVVPGTLKINKKAAKIKKVTPKKKTYKANKETKKLAKNKTFKLKAKITGEKAKVTFKKANKAGKAMITVSKKGKVTVKKGLAKGTYKVKVKATKAATKHYKKATKTVTVKVVVK